MSTLQTVINKMKSKSLSSNDLLKLVNYKANLMTYPELTKFRTIDEALGPHKALIILYETRKNYGHWCCVFRRNNKIIEFFDSYGLLPDDELKFIPEHFRDLNNERLPHLTVLLYKSEAQIEYNDKQLQQKMKDINTCGRWVGLRLILRELPIDTFNYMFTKYKFINADDIVTILSINI